ncbi:MAG: acetate CoA/acetoacetate CoA-transferase alpha subunit [Bacillota bacterium]|jgi:acetate CoA/acetoacetate CoA-transferase alpha subunit|nr:acetate CoA/acetoacetate CoA-transferase alpha subunit [Bacillota bacterium]MDK2927208.1 acetate CoA/acetoacetate CoA-transferase alpha subunit [Bacillota bacterium]
MKSKEVSLDAALSHVKDGMTIMIGGFLGLNAPLAAIDRLVELGVKDLTLIAAVNAYPGGGFGIGKLIENHQVKKYIGSHIGTCPAAVEQYKNGELEVEFYPQGTVIEKIRAGGAGLGGILTPTGVGTLMEEGKQKVTVDGRVYLVETPLKADVAIIRGYKADKVGNILYRGTPNSNPIMALAADYVIAEVDYVVEAGEIEPDRVGTPGILVDAVVRGYGEEKTREIFRDLWTKNKKLA